ncbi:unnamed protein product [Ectocarpus sp. 8 AP-2014]
MKDKKVESTVYYSIYVPPVQCYFCLEDCCASVSSLIVHANIVCQSMFAPFGGRVLKHAATPGNKRSNQKRVAIQAVTAPSNRFAYLWSKQRAQKGTAHPALVPSGGDGLVSSSDRQTRPTAGPAHE